MKVLLLDDIQSVVEGLKVGISWKMMGIDELFCAYNTVEARKILKEESIDILLSDIEMPQENGIKLLSWIRKEGLDTEVIFLTAHADFEYMKEAIREGSIDYILQPAPYDEVRAAVLRAMQRIEEKRAKRQIYSYGKAMLTHKESLTEAIFEKLLVGSMDKKAYDEYQEAMRLPAWGTDVYPFVVQFRDVGFEVSLLNFVFQNILDELFDGYEQNVLIFARSQKCYYALIFTKDKYIMDYDGIVRQIGIFLDHVQRIISKDVALCVTKAVKIQEISKAFADLSERASRNVLPGARLIELSEKENENDNKSLARGFAEYYKRWRDYLVSGYKTTLRAEIAEYLGEKGRKGELDSEELHFFYMDFTDLVNEAIRKMTPEEQLSAKEQQRYDLYQKAVGSLDGMLEYVDSMLALTNTPPDSNLDLEAYVKKYVHEHMSEEIRRSELAQELNLNPDYLSRAFKKETGITLVDFILNEKMQVARGLIKTTKLPLSFISSKVGYDNSSYFAQSYKKVFGITPSTERM